MPILKEILSYRTDADSENIIVAHLGKIEDCPKDVLNLKITAWDRSQGIYIV